MPVMFEFFELHYLKHNYEKQLSSGNTVELVQQLTMSFDFNCYTVAWKMLVL